MQLLLVDDDEGIRGMIAATLGDEGYDVVTAPDGATALALVGPPGHWRPDLILLDVRMADMDGPSFAAAYGQIPGPRPPIVLLTAMPGVDAADATERVGAVGFLVKPFDLEALVAVVNHHTGQRPERARAGNNGS